jgi:uncharacterized damage-inducible protein DinB
VIETLSMHEYFIQLFDYNDWANQRMLRAAETLTQEQLFKDHAHSWGSIHGLLVHILAAERIWLSRWQGHSPTTLLNAEDFPTLEAVQVRWAEVTKEMRAFVGSQTDGSLVLPVTYTNTKGITFTLKLWEMMAHLVNHGTHHRGELAAMFAMLGVAHPEDDWLELFLLNSGQL